MTEIRTMRGLVKAFRRWANSLPAGDPLDVPGADDAELATLAALGAIAAAVAPDHAGDWPKGIRSWTTSAPILPENIADAVCTLLGRHEDEPSATPDPLAALYNASISPVHRRRLGTVFTPMPLVEHMLDLVESVLGEEPRCVVDPGAGVGAFTVAAASRWPDSHVISVDVNPVTLGLLAARIGFAIDAEHPRADALRRVELKVGDYLDQLETLFAAEAPRPTLVLGNPPFTRIQELPLDYRRKSSKLCAGVIESGHANLAIQFQAATLNRMRPDDCCCMVLPASFTYTRASQGLRDRLSNSPRPVRIQRTRAADRPFVGRPVQAAIVLVGPEERKRLDAQPQGAPTSPSSILLEDWFDKRSQVSEVGETIELSRVAKVQRGVATGANKMFFLTDEMASELPPEVLVPAVLTLRGFDEPELNADRHRTWGDEHTRRWLLAIPRTSEVSDRLRDYLRGFEDEVGKRFLVAQRKPWYALGRLVRPDLLIAPLSKHDFKVVVNSARAVPSNNLMAITAGDGLDPRRLADWLRSSLGQAELERTSRGYPGGSRKLEPGDLRGLRLPTTLLLPEA